MSAELVPATVQRGADNGFAAQTVQVEHRALGRYRGQIGASGLEFAADAKPGHQELDHEEQHGNGQPAPDHPMQD